MEKARRHFTPQEKVAALKRHLVSTSVSSIFSWPGERTQLLGPARSLAHRRGEGTNPPAFDFAVGLWIVRGSAYMRHARDTNEFFEIPGDELRSVTRRQRAKLALLNRRNRGFRYTRHPGYGYKWVGRKGRMRRVPDEAEREVMRCIFDMRSLHQTWESIFAELRKRRVRTREGREWSRSRIRQAYLAEQRFREQSGPATSEQQ